ncbi:MAG: class I SAM-dependent methyltransferase [Candidatus Kerfeldbacteria bacterium]|nr:class I SAM-dependent methyltransferase [Candidatus Kerfeldbacteria bacterium]
MPRSKFTTPVPETLTETFQLANKRFYREEEDYDWVRATDRLVGVESIFHKFRERTVRKLIGRYGRPGQYLDAGCGSGLFLRHLPPGSVGLDINPRNIDRARQHAPHAEPVLGDIEAMPFPDGTFSTVVLTEVIEHLPDPRPALREVMRVITSAGIVIGSTPRRSIFWKLRGLSSTCPGEPFHREFSRQELYQLLAAFGRPTVAMKHFGMTWAFTLQRR